ncbi:DUF6691 family protein [Terasakiispira papahanaumokuakeensis]
MKVIMNCLMALLSGLLFGIGLVVSGMTDPQRVVGFLDVTGDWDPTLMAVLGGAVLTTFVGFRLLRRLGRPWLSATFEWPTRRDLDRPLVIGASLFGLGWGLSGYCPGPALLALNTGDLSVWGLVIMMAVGWWAAQRWSWQR